MASRDQLIGSEIAGFRIESLIGRGGMGSVYVAEQLGLGRRVALKVLPAELSASESFRHRFERESRLAASLDHPHVIPIFASGEADGVLYIAMRYVDGADLATLIASEGPLSPERVANVMAQVGGALDAAHRRGLVHRDVKPGNVLVAASDSEEQDYSYLSDFGLTRLTSSDSALTRTGQFMGTVAYAAPEQFEGKTADAKSDLYSLGCVAFESLTGEPPFPREQEAAVMFAHLQQAPPLVTDRRPDAPRALDEVLARAMAKAPDDRFGSGREFASALESAIAPAGAPDQGAGVLAAPPGGRRPEIDPGSGGAAGAAGRARTGRRVLVAALVALAVVGATVGAVIGLSSGGAPAASGGPGGTASASGGPSGTGTEAAGPPPGGSIGVDTVARLDPSTGRVIADYPVGSQPENIVFSGGAVWVINRKDRTLSRINPELPPTNPDAVATRGAGIPSPCELAPAADGGVWLGDCEHGLVSHVSPTTLSVDRGPYRISRPMSLAEYRGSLWVVSENAQGGPDTVVRLAPDTGRRLAVVPVGRGAGAITVTMDALWGTAFDDGEIWRLDPRTLAVTHFGGWTGPTIVWPATSRNLWVVDEPAGTTSKYDPVNDHVVGLFHQGRVWSLVTVGGAVWTLDPNDESLTKIDPDSDETLLHYVLPYADFMDVGAGSLWISAEAD